MRNLTAEKIELSFYNCCRIAATLLLFAFFSANGFSQDTLHPTTFKKVKIKKSLTKDPILLANELTKDLATDKQKFDAIFTWVVMNMRYNTRAYNSGKAFSSKRSAVKILRKRRGVCMDYAYLMDTLCAVAGIQNVTVTGYVKEVHFDIYDTLYFDTHAWSAVKLNGLWYVYDPTWSSGSTSFTLTKLGDWRKKCIDKQLKKARPVLMCLKKKKKKKRKGLHHRFCDDMKLKANPTSKTIEVMALPWFPRVIISVVGFFPYVKKERYQAVANTKYYLASPEVFAVNHFPNDPIWSLTNRVNSVEEFSADTVYYDRNLLDSINQQRSGRICVQCDDYYFADEIQREGRLVSGSLTNNPLNRFVPATYNLFMAGVLFEKTVKETDSLTKMNLIDSTNNYLDSCRLELNRSRSASRIESRFHSNKNKEKRSQLLTENRKHKAVANSIYVETNKSRSRLRNLYSKSYTYDHRGMSSLKKFKKSFRQEISTKTLKEEKRIKLREQLAVSLFKADSLNNVIAILQDSFVVDIGKLWGNVLTERQVLSPLINYFDTDGWAREFYNFDSYDKQIRDLRTKLDTQEQLLVSTANSNINALTDSIFNEFVLINNLIRQQNILNLQSVKLMLTLSAVGMYPKDSITIFKETTEDLIKQEICTNVMNSELIYVVRANFVYFLDQLKALKREIEQDNESEKSRYKTIQEHIALNKQRLSNAAQGNYGLTTSLKRALILERKRFLEELKKKK